MKSVIRCDRPFSNDIIKHNKTDTEIFEEKCIFRYFIEKRCTIFIVVYSQKCPEINMSFAYFNKLIINYSTILFIIFFFRYPRPLWI